VGSLLLPLAAILVSLDFFKDRNLIAAWIPLVSVLAAGLAARRALPLGLSIAAAICALGIAVDIQVTRNPDMQRQDWRALAHALGSAPDTRAVVVLPAYAKTPLEVYGQRFSPAIDGLRVREIVLIGQTPSNTPSALGPDGPRLVQARAFSGLHMLRYQGHGFITLTPSALRASPAAVLLQPGPRLSAWILTYLRQLNRWQQLAQHLRASNTTAPPTNLLMPAAGSSALLDLPPEVAQEPGLRNALQQTMHAATTLAAQRSARAQTIGSFLEALKRLTVAL
jgi:hypothetical protein